ncbi:hypothetical protein SAY87_029016 [Trapa incisa]|uniref:ERCC4 domain-containing protein n=1 Tax=Trapa incisa TaxID=236973 RepID=A0AAN7KV39_9MYRT|nr:hypothetical protein SAY87_029016 [Trapa incisa]
MSEPIILSDDEDRIVLDTPLPIASKKRRTAQDRGLDPPVLILDDDPTPKKFSCDSTPSFVAETPYSEIAIVKCTSRVNLPEDPLARVSDDCPRFSGIRGMIDLESGYESDKIPPRGNLRENEVTGTSSDAIEVSWRDFSLAEEPEYPAQDYDLFDGCGKKLSPTSSPETTHLEQFYSQIDQEDCPDKENFRMNQIAKHKSRQKQVPCNRTSLAEGMMQKKMTKEERLRAAEEKRLQRDQEKVRAAEEKRLKKEQEKIRAAEEKQKREQAKLGKKAEAANLKKIKQWEKGKFALKSIVAEIDAKVVELGSIGGHLLTRFSEKGISFRIKSNPMEKSIVWTMSIPEQISQLDSKCTEISYIVLVYEAEDFCNLINGSLLEHVDIVRRLYPSHTVCYLTNRLMAYINKREQELYKSSANSCGWRRPPVEEALAKLTTHFVRVHSRQCVDEAEVAEHIVGLTSSLASCHFRKKLSRLSVNANGSVIPKVAVDRNLINGSLWLKALVSIPKVQPRFAIAIWKKYPTMKSLMTVYMDPDKTIYEKECLLKDLVTEGLVGQDRRLGEVCSKRIYRVLMAQNGSIKTDDVEDGADFFRS